MHDAPRQKSPPASRLHDGQRELLDKLAEGSATVPSTTPTGTQGSLPHPAASNQPNAPCGDQRSRCLRALGCHLLVSVELLLDLAAVVGTIVPIAGHGDYLVSVDAEMSDLNSGDY